jgi:hypothetical protein
MIPNQTANQPTRRPTTGKPRIPKANDAMALPLMGGATEGEIWRRPSGTISADWGTLSASSAVITTLGDDRNTLSPPGND